MKGVFIFLCLITGTFGAFSNDTIFKVNKEVISCKIKEITTEEIKYLDPSVSNDIVFALDKNEVKEVHLENGKLLTFSHSMTGPEHYKDQNKNVVKARVFSPLFGHTQLGFERSLRPGRSLEVGISAIGLGIEFFDKAKGGSVRCGYKFIKSPDFYLKGMKYAHLLKGLYFKPELAISFYEIQREDYYNYYSYEPYTYRENVFSAALLLNVGNQWVFDDVISIDYFFGMGYGYTSADDSWFRKGYGYNIISNTFPLAINAGFNFGVLF